MNDLVVIIPSKTASNLKACSRAVTRNEPDAGLFVIDDGLGEDWNPRPDEFTGWTFKGEKPFCFARNCNLGMKQASGSDVVLLNDDAILQTPGGFALLQQEAEDHPEFGIISSTTNVAGNLNQKPKGIGLREELKSVAFVCVYIPRRTIERVGFMDERFGGLTTDGHVIYGWCDNDYCRRVRQAGLKIGIHDGCFVDHGSLRSSFRGDPYSAGNIFEGQKLYQEKWGDLL